MSSHLFNGNESRNNDNADDVRQLIDDVIEGRTNSTT